MSSALRTLRNVNLLYLIAGRTTAAFGNSLFLLALPWYAIAVLHSTQDLMLTGLALTAPRILGLFVGVLVDRWNNKLVLIGSDITRAVLAVAVFWLVGSGTHLFGVVLILVFVITALAEFFSPAFNAYFKAVVPKDQLSSAASLRQSAAKTGQVLGLAVGGGLIATSGIPLLFVIDSASFIVSALSIFVIPIKGLAGNRVPRSSFWAELKEGYQFIGSSWRLLRIIIAVAITNFTLAPFDIVLAFYIKDHLGLSSVFFGLASAALAVGDVVGSLLSGLFLSGIDLARTAKYSLVGIGLAIASVGLITNISLLMVVIFLGGILIGSVSGNLTGLILHSVPRELMGRVRSPLNAIAGFGMPLGTLIFGALLRHIPVEWVFVLLGLCCVLSAVNFWIRSSHSSISSIASRQP